MSNLKGRVSLVLALVMMIMTILPVAIVNADNGDIMTLRATYNGSILNNKQTISAVNGGKILVSVSNFIANYRQKAGGPNLTSLDIYYIWDSNPISKASTGSATTTITIPSNFSAGSTHTLQLEAVINDTEYGYIGNSNIVTIFVKLAGGDSVIPGNNVDEELIIEPWMKENSDLEDLSVSLRNEYDNDKANKNIFALNENVTYYIDYKNGTGKDKKDVKLVFELPLDVQVIDACGGTVNGRTITWEFPEGLEEDESGTKTVVVRYTGFAKSNVKSKIVYPVADIYEGKKIVDSSAVINLIFRDEDTEILSDEHYPYMHGDANADTFRPDDGITRAEGALVLTRIFGMNTSGVQVTNVYPDLGETYEEAQKAIIAATNAGLINGYTDGTYRPNQKMTRAEFMKIISVNIALVAEDDGLEDNIVDGLRVRTADEEIKTYKNPTKTYVVNGNAVTAHWASPYVTLLARLNMTDLTSKNKNLRLDDTITRAEVAQLINFYLFRAPAEVTSRTKSGFSDVAKNHKLFADIIEATRPAHTYTLTLDGKEVAIDD